MKIYTKGNLSRPTGDKFPAVGSMAKRLVSPQTGEYLAGFFRNQIKSQLWLYSSRMNNQRARSWRAPSWSWASIDGHINFPIRRSTDAEREYLFAINHINTQLEDMSNRCGALRSPSLMATGRPLEARSDFKEGDGGRKEILIVDDEELDFVVFDDTGESRDKTTFSSYLLLSQLDPRGHSFTDQARQKLIGVTGLVLCRLQSGSFRRVGMLERGRVASEVVDKWLKREEKVITIM